MLASNNIAALEKLKIELANKYKVKDLGEAKTIIGWNITWDLIKKTLKVDKLSFIRDLLEKESLTNYHIPNIPMKAKSFIKILKPDNYKKANLTTY